MKLICVKFVNSTMETFKCINHYLKLLLITFVNLMIKNVINVKNFKIDDYIDKHNINHIDRVIEVLNEKANIEIND